MANEPMKQEKPLHRKAFEVYYALGEERSVRSVAKKMNKSATTIQNWSKSFNWKERVEIRDVTVTEAFEKKVVDTIVSLKADYHKIVKALIVSSIEDIKLGKLKINSVTDLEKMVTLSLTLMGEEDRRAKGAMEEMSNAIQASMQMFGQMQYDGKDRIDD